MYVATVQVSGNDKAKQGNKSLKQQEVRSEKT